MFNFGFKKVHAYNLFKLMYILIIFCAFYVLSLLLCEQSAYIQFHVIPNMRNLCDYIVASTFLLSSGFIIFLKSSQD